MQVRVHQGEVQVEWNDRGDSDGYPLALFVEGLNYQIRSEKTLRDLHECLNFLFGRPGA